jgi:hypothetical protein
MTRIPVSSSKRIASWGWEDDALEVEFMNPPGVVYEYAGVEESTWGSLQAMPGGSAGKAFDSLIKGKYSYQRIS